MLNNDILTRARYIFSTGRLIHDRILSVKTAALSELGKDNIFNNLSLAQLHATMMIQMRGQVSITELSNLLSVSPPSASAMVDRLVEKGLLTRKSSKKDRRKVVVQVSTKAQKDMTGIEEKILKSFIELVSKLGPETTEKWCEVLGQIKMVLEQEVQSIGLSS